MNAEQLKSSYDRLLKDELLFIEHIVAFRQFK